MLARGDSGGRRRSFHRPIEESTREIPVFVRFAFLIAFLFVATGAVSQSGDLQVIALHELWEVGADDDDDVLFGVISSIDIDAEGNVFVLDRQLTEVTMFSADGEYIGPIGREGEGPGEFRRIGHVFVSGPGEIAVMQRMPGRIVCVNTDGSPGGTITLPEAFSSAPAYFYSGQRAGEDLVLSARQIERNEDGVSFTTALLRIDPSGKEIARFSEKQDTRNMSSFTVEEKSNAPVLWTVDADGNVYVNDEFDAYSIRVYDPSGALVRTIQRDYEHRQRSAEEIEMNTPRMAIRHRGGQRRDAEGVPSTTDRDIQALFARPDGTLWVLNSRGAFEQPDGYLATFDVFDGDGSFLHQVGLRSEGDFRDDGLHLVGDRLFVTRGLRAAQRAERGGGEEDEDAEPMSVTCYQLSSGTGVVAGSK
jgi:hypothetical protein